jgi:hypothetical protein
LNTASDEQTKSIQQILENGNFTAPDYQEHSILNIPASAAYLLDVAGFKHNPADPVLLNPIKEGVKNIIVVLIDALAFHRLEQWLAEEPDLVWHKLIQGGFLLPTTSICPSTTCSAISSYWTDSSAAEHGVMGYEMWLKEYGITANMIEHKPITYRRSGGDLSLAGFDPETFLPVPSTSRLFQERGVEIHAFQHYAIIHSGLSRMFMREADRHGISTAPDMWISIRELLESSPQHSKYIWAYWDRLDGISHLYGPDSERAKAEFMDFSQNFETYFLERLDPALKKDTLIMLAADHGQITTDNTAAQYDLNNHPDFMAMLHLKPTGENRLAYLHIRPGNVAAVKEYIEQTWPDQFSLIDPQEAVSGGLFGGGTPHPAIYDRLGDLIVAAKGTAYWWWANKPNPLIGRHGGLSAEEMLVPFLAARLM